MREVPLFVAACLAACHAVPPADPAPIARPVEAVASKSSSRLLPDPEAVSLAKAALAAIEHRRRVVLANLANVDVPGWKRGVAGLRGHVAFAGSDGMLSVPTVFEVVRDHAQGAVHPTGRSLDLAIDGDGFFAFMQRDGSIGYTRNGALNINADGKLVTSEGRVLLPEITVPADLLELNIAPDGVVCGRTAGNPDCTTTFGQLTLSRFVNAPGLRAAHDGFATTEAAGPPITQAPGLQGAGTLRQGCLERSNVQLANELLELQTIERRREALAKALEPYGLLTP